ncbi:rho GTPase-activating protein [Rhodotorula toruloides]|uniref:Rho GTPase-activating protein n=1 Tax=Rhodotorula toruloides TaxID=5286 RepID=A0A511K6X6_RHOTO|nr:rho GTPase-activating protein [Rhodotorula toruloides]
MSLSSPPQPATLGLATQLRTPPLDGALFSSASTNDVHSQVKKLTPAMRAEGKERSPRMFTVPQWSAKDPPRSAYSASTDGHYSSLDMARANSRGVMSDLGFEPVSPTSKTHSRTQSSPHNGFKTNGSPVMQRLYRPESPKSATPPTPQQVHTPSEVTATGAPVFNTVDFSFGSQPPLDLGITLSRPSYSTYKATSTPLARSASADAVHTPPLPPASRDDVPGTPYAAEVRVSVAQRAEKGPSFRKASLAELNAERPTSGPLFEDYRRSSSATTSTASSSARNDSQNLSVPRLRPPRASSPGGTNRPMGQGLRSSYAGSSVSDSGTATTAFYRRASSVYVPNSPGGLTAVADTTVGAGTGSQKITPGAKLPLNLLTLSRRTAHVSDVPGYIWRLNLLEKLELIMGSFLRIEDAEAILSIGNSSEKKKKRSEFRKSQIGMHTPSSDSLRQSEDNTKKFTEPKTFFSRMKRVLSVQGPPARESSSSSNAAKVVFGASLAQVAEYGFVTSMIAGQRHDLPGVCFSTVEEIYRRGQGLKVPGLMQMQGEPGRIAKLVQIYNTPPDYGEHHDLSIESIHNVTSLLKRYLRDLPEPVLDQRLWRLFQAACVDSNNSLKARVASAQIILRLLPTPNFSLLVYLVAFLSQMPLFPENKLSLATVSGIFGAMIMAPRPTPQKKPAKGEMVISGPGESVDSAGATAKKGEAALRWLLEHWSSVADGLLDADFDIDPATIVDTNADGSPDRGQKTSELAPTLDIFVPQSELHIRQPATQQEPTPLAPPIQLPRDAPAPPTHEQARSQRQPFSSVVEQHTAELDSIPRFEDVSKTYDSQPPTPVAQNNSLRRDGERLGPERSGSSADSHTSPPLDLLAAAAFAITKSPSIYQEEAGPPTPQKGIQQPHFPSPAAAVLPSPPEEVGPEREEPASIEERDDEEEEHSSPEDSTDEPPRLSSTHSSASSEHSISIKTPPQPALTHEAGSNGLSKPFDVDSRSISMRDTSVLHDVADFDETSVYSFPAPPISPTRPSPFLDPSPFLSQAEIDAAMAAEHAKEVQSMPDPPNVANYADRTGTSDSAKGDSASMQRHSKELVVEKALVLASSREMVKMEPARSAADEADDAPPPLPQKSPTPNGIRINGLPSSRTSSTLRMSDYEPLERVGAKSSPSKANPGRASATLLRSVDEQLPETQQLVEKQRQEVQSLWKQLTDLELERTAERAEMIDLRQEVESFKERMTKRLCRSLNEQEKKKLETAEHKAKDAETRVRMAQEEARRAREDLAQVEEKRRKEQADAKSQIEALEAQLGSIRAVLLGGAGLKM